MIDHAAKVARVAARLRAHDPSRPLSLRKKSPPHQVPKRNDATRRDEKIDMSDLDRVLAIDEDARVCVAEPGVTFSDLVDATLPLGLAPAIVPELPSITIGGAVAGCSIESASFRYGGFHDTCLEYEVVTARGDVLRATPRENALLFQMMHGTFGTLGVLTELRFRLVPAKPFVHVTYERHATIEAYQAAIRRHFDARDIDFMDGIIHSPRCFVLSLGRFVDDAPYASRYDWTKIYWKSTGERAEDHLRTRDYFFRYDAGVTNVHPKSRVGRFFFGKLLRSTRLLRAANALHFLLPDRRPDVTVDLFLPLSKVEAFMNWYERELDYFPLWCVPYRRVRDYEWIAPRVFDGLPDELFLDLAIYGAKQRPGHDEYAEIERELDELAALKTLISHNRYDEATFWRTWNKPNYDAVKRVTDPDGVLRDLYDKTCRAMQGRV